LTFAVFHENVLREFGPLLQQLGVSAVQGWDRQRDLLNQARAGCKVPSSGDASFAGVLVSAI